MTNPNEPAFPMAGSTDGNGNHTYPEFGLTVREHFAALAMQGILAAQIHGMNNMPSEGPFAAIAVNAADALIAELNKEPPK